ncbi:MAG: PilT/PilU family type 4a pilus ATPase [Deltaproteobacteria bacterium]|nr:PilT/PilU family type 4a pilus ATPase [Deltaproteobacteria bacterium]
MSVAIPISTSVDLLNQLVTAVVTHGGSDLHLRTGAPPFMRAGGQLIRLECPPLSAATVQEVIRLTVGDTPVPAGASSFEYSYEQANTARFRVHAFRERAQLGVCLRAIPFRVPAFQELRLPPVVKALATAEPGLVLVTGATGSGKSTTLASMLHHMAAQETLHILTLEDPVEYRFQGTRSCVTQRELGRDVPTFREGLQAALREDPDVMFIGEIRDTETLEVVMHAAESGHAVFSTFHTGSALKTVQRIIGMHAPVEQPAVRARLADCLRGSISQLLLQRRGLRQRVLATEVLVNNYRIKEAIRDPQKVSGIPQVLEKSNEQLMHTFDQSLMALVREGLVAADHAALHAASPTDFRRSLTLAGVQE